MNPQIEEEKKKFEGREESPERVREKMVKKIKLDIEEGKQKTLA